MSPKTLLATVVVVAVAAADAFSSNDALADLVVNLVTLDSTELIVVSDFVRPDQAQLLRLLNEAEIPFYSYEISELGKMQDKLSSTTPCPLFGKPSPENNTVEVAANDIYIRRQQVLPTQRYHSSIFVWAERDVLARAIEIFDDTPMKCAQRKDAGLFHTGNRMYFLSEDRSTTNMILLNSENVAEHRSVAAMERIGEDAFAFWSYDFGASQTGLVSLNRVWTRGTRIDDLNSVFTEAKRFRGRSLRVTAMPWSWFVIATKLTEEEGYISTRRYKDYWGLEITLLQEMAKKLNFKFTMSNPSDGQWGVIGDGGVWTGMVADVASGRADVAAADILMKFDRFQVAQTSVPYAQGYLTFASPPPREAPKYFSFLRPFDLLVWPLIFASVFVVGAAMFAVSTAEVRIINRPVWIATTLKEWITLQRATWYTFGTLMGESITRDTRTARAWALRIVVGSWMIYCVVMTASFSGNLKAYLTTPIFTDPIRTVEAILDSGLPWRMALFGAEFEAQMEKTESPTLKALWKGKTPVAFGPAAELEDVYRGRAVTFDYLTAIQASIYTRYSTPDGNPLIFLSPRPVFGSDWVGLFFAEINPWKERFDQVIMTFIEAGLVDKWKLEALLRMRAEAVAESGSAASEDQTGSRSDALTLDDLQGIFIAILMGIPLSLAVFAYEKAKAARSSRKSKKNDNLMCSINNRRSNIGNNNHKLVIVV